MGVATKAGDKILSFQSPPHAGKGVADIYFNQNSSQKSYYLKEILNI